MVKIITDTTSGLPTAVAERYGIPVIPQVIHLGDKSYYEGIEIDNATFMQKLKTSPVLPKTAAPPPELFVEEFKVMVPLGQPILCIHPSTDLSGTVRSAEVAALEFPEADIRVIDTRVVGSPLATLVELAAEWAQAGVEADIIEARVKEMGSRCRLYFMVATLEYLAKGGRIGGASALLGSVLQIKPILTLCDGRIETHEKARTHKHALARLKELALASCPPGGEGYLSVMHAAEPEVAEALARELGAKLNQPEVPILDVPPAIVTHAGPGILAVAFFVRNTP